MEFPECVLENILVRLPIKDILSCKRVCRSWFTLISSSSGSYFASFYARNSPFALIFRAQGSRSDGPSLSLLEFAGESGGENTNCIPIMTPEMPDDDEDYGFCTDIIGSCGCSVFMLRHKLYRQSAADDHPVVHRVYLFNPVSGSCVKVAEDRIEQWCEGRTYKVGFIPSNNTYKLVRFAPFREKAENLEILTVGLDEDWRKVEDDQFPLLFRGYWSYQGMISFNGAYHWLSREHEETIFTFGLLEEKMGTSFPKPKPHGGSRLSRLNTRLTILNGRLSVADLSNNSTMVIWTMREYGVAESWSRVIVLALCDEYPQKSRYYGLVPVAVLANGDVLFAENSDEGMCFYSLREKRLMQVEHADPASFLPRLYENTYLPRF